MPIREMEYPEWAAVGRRLGGIVRCSQWWLGDWIRYGTAKYGEKYAQAAKVTGYDIHSLRNMAYVASKFSDVSRRRDNLSWSHHESLAAFDPDQQERWLDRASAERLSVADLRLELRQVQRSRNEPLDVEGGVTDALETIAVVCPNCGHKILSSTEGERE